MTRQESLKYRNAAFFLRERAKSLRKDWNKGLVLAQSPKVLEEIEEAAKMIDDLLFQCCSSVKEEACCLTCSHLYFKDFLAFCPFQTGPRQPEGYCLSWEDSHK